MTFNELGEKRIESIIDMAKNAIEADVLNPYVLFIQLLDDDEYIDHISALCDECGIPYGITKCAESMSRKDMLDTVKNAIEANKTKATAIVITPLDWIDCDTELLNLIPYKKDVQCLTPYSRGIMYDFPNENIYYPPMLNAVLDLIVKYSQESKINDVALSYRKDYDFRNVQVILETLSSNHITYYFNHYNNLPDNYLRLNSNFDLSFTDRENFFIEDLDTEIKDRLYFAYLIQNIVRSGYYKEDKE